MIGGMRGEAWEECWLDSCARISSGELRVGGYHLCLCTEHRRELEDGAADAWGYSSADPPSNGQEWWPWRLEP